MQSAKSLNRRGILTGLGAAALNGCSSAVPTIAPAPTPSVSGANNSTALGAKLSPYVTRGEVPGVVAAVARGGSEKLEVFGVKTAGQSEPITGDTIFRIASLTKPVTATATMMLVEDGKLKLDEPIERLLPELANRKVLRRLDSQLDDVVPARRAITVRDLLTFRMGFGIVLAAPGTYPIQAAADDLKLGQGMPAPAVVPAPDEWLKRFGTLPLMSQPGEKWLYNTGADVLGVLIARASGKPFDVFLRERLFGPLGMQDTDFSVPASKRSRFVPSYVVDPQTNGLVLYDAVNGQWSHPPAFPSGGAGLVSTVPDFLNFGKLMLGNGTFGKARLLSPESVKLMTTDALTPENKAFGALVPGFFDHHGWGFCMAVVTSKDELGRSAGSYGWDGGLGTSWYADPSTNTTGLLFTQRAFNSPDPPPIFQDFWRTLNAS
jgi:CubicO group peptidase (beta-lactamase class C family)